PPAGGPDRTGYQGRPQRDVATRVADHGRLAGRAAWCMGSNNLAHRDGEHSERIILPEILFGGEWKTVQIVQMLKIAGGNAGLRKLLAVLRHQRGTGKRLFEPRQLQGAKLVETCSFNWLRSFKG